MTDFQDSSQEFMRGVTWTRIFDRWKQEVANLVVFDPIFLTVTIQDLSAINGERTTLAWWRPSKVKQNTERLQLHMERYPGTIGPFQDEIFNTGCLDTIFFLHEVYPDLEKTAAVLMLASMFGIIHNHRRGPLQDWPSWYALNAFDAEVRTCLGWSPRDGWHSACTNVLPYYRDPDRSRVESIYDLISVLADSHSLLLSAYTPIQIKFDNPNQPR